MLKSLGEQIRDARIAHGLTQAELAHRSKVSYSQLRRIERGLNTKLETLMKLQAELPNLASLRIQHVDVQLTAVDHARPAAADASALARLWSWLWRKA